LNECQNTTGLPDYEFKYNTVGTKSVVKRGHKLTASEVLNYDATGQFTDWDQGELNTSYGHLDGAPWPTDNQFLSTNLEVSLDVGLCSEL
jgi:hypothetical protein